MTNHSLTILSAVVGWVYFACWSLSFYPQVILNYKRKSVIGLSFDFLLFNITGYLCYSVFNCVLFWDHFVKVEYIDKYGPPIPVQPNDIAFALHAFILTVITIVQCFIYERGDQKNSLYSIGLGVAIWASILVVIGLGTSNTITWLWVINYLSYVKLFITFIKYVPQAWINYKRKSTIGWSIGNVLLDFSGGILSFLQMFIDASNSGNWNVMVGDPVKLGLSLISILFDILFMVQHYLLYNNKSSTSILSQNTGYHNIQDKPNNVYIEEITIPDEEEQQKQQQL